MNQRTGNFEMLDGLSEAAQAKKMGICRGALAALNPQYVPGKSQEPQLAVCEEVDVGGTKVRILYIKKDGRVGGLILGDYDSPELSFDSVVQIKLVKFKVTRRNNEGKIGFRMLNERELGP